MTDITAETFARYAKSFLEDSTSSISDHEDDCRDNPDERYDLADPQCEVNSRMLGDFVTYARARIQALEVALRPFEKAASNARRTGWPENAHALRSGIDYNDDDGKPAVTVGDLYHAALQLKAPDNG